MITGSAVYTFEANKKKYILIPFGKDFFKESSVKSNNYLWFHDPDVTRHNSHGLFPYTEAKRAAFFNELESSSNLLVLAILAIEDDGYLHVGNVSLQGINWIYKSAELAIIIGDTSFHGQGVGSAACKTIIEHGFKKLNLNRIWTGTSETNIGMQRTANKCGMQLEGIFRDGMFLHGKYVDIQCFSILRKEWEAFNND